MSVSFAASGPSGLSPPMMPTHSSRYDPTASSTTRSCRDVDELVRILEAGVNVVTTAAFITGHAMRVDRQRIVDVCTRGNSSIFGSGMNPGFANLLGIVAAGICDRIDAITILESVDSTGYDSPETEIPVGFGRPVNDPQLPAMTREGTAVFEDAVWLVADAIGVALDEVRCEAEYAETTEDLDLGSWSIAAGCVAGVAASWQGIRAGKPVVSLNVRWRKGNHLEPDWPLEHGYVVEVDGRPSVRTKLEVFPPPDFVATVVRRLHGARDDHDRHARSERDPVRVRGRAGHRHVPRPAADRGAGLGLVSYPPSREVATIRERIDHPIIDNDGHIIEYLPLVRDILVELAGEDVAQRFDIVVNSGRLTQTLSPAQRRGLALARMPWWGIPTRNTFDRATAMLPRLLYGRLDQIGIDVAIVYPTYGLTAIHLTDDELRPALSRAFNVYVAEVYGPYRDRILPVACIPTFTPDEAIVELEYAVGQLGLRAVMMGGAIPRPIPGTDAPGARWIDGLGHASVYDYTPLWEKCVELGVAPTFHSTGTGWGARTSPTNYVFNHIGNFAAAGELTARSLFFGGVPMQFPELRFAFLEGGTAWACNLLHDTLGHWEKRNRDAIGQYDPAALDRAQLEGFFAEYAEGRMRERLGRLGEGLNMLSEPIGGDDVIDEFAESRVGGPDDIIEIFTERYFFGCEADDPLAALAFDRARNPRGTQLRAMFASDIGHWDVPDFAGVLGEAWELVDDGHLDLDDFRAFTFDNPVALWTGTNSRLLRGNCDRSGHLSELRRWPAIR